MMTLIKSLALCHVALLPLLFGLENVSRPARIMMQERRKAFCTGAVQPSDDEAFIGCDDCRRLIERLSNVVRHEKDQIKKHGEIIYTCHKFLSMFGYSSQARCSRLVSNYLEPIEFVIHADKLPDVCLIVGLCPEDDLDFELDNLDIELNDLDMSMAMADQQEYSTKGNDRDFKNVKSGNIEELMSRKPIRSEQDSPNITFVQISDIHFDPHYSEGASTCCLEVVCCHSLFGEQKNISLNEILQGRRAGPFGDYNCDVPVRTVRAMLDFILTLEPRPDFTVYVGDSSVHAILENLGEKLEDNEAVTDILVEKLQNLGPIFPVFGNHETFPQSVYFRPGILAQIILRSISKQWPQMFDTTDEQRNTIREHGYYVAEINPSLWILNFNSLYSYNTNIFALLGRLDPLWSKQKDFVRTTLERARSQSAKVIFTSHMRPKYEETYPEYAEYLDSLVTEFSDVIILQLYGHIHDDSFLVHYDPDNPRRPVGTSLSAPSLTTLYSLRQGVNPSIRVFTLERDTWTPLDYTQYYFDLEEANRDGTIMMKEHYQFTEEYDLPDLSPASFASLSDRIHTNWAYFQKYQRNHRVLASVSDRCSENDTECRRALSCHTRTAEPWEYFKCLIGL